MAEVSHSLSDMVTYWAVWKQLKIKYSFLRLIWKILNWQIWGVTEARAQTRGQKVPLKLVLVIMCTLLVSWPLPSPPLLLLLLTFLLTPPVIRPFLHPFSVHWPLAAAAHSGVLSISAAAAAAAAAASKQLICQNGNSCRLHCGAPVPTVLFCKEQYEISNPDQMMQQFILTW